MKEKSKNIEEKSEVKPKFNKKKWREQKYSIKHKVERWKQNERKKAEANYRREEGSCAPLAGSDVKRSLHGRLREAQLEFERIKIKKKEELEQAKIRRLEKQKRIDESKKRRAEKSRKLMRKTKRGQPVMKERLELLQEKIEKLAASGLL